MSGFRDRIYRFTRKPLMQGILTGFILLMSFALFSASYDNYKMQQEFLKSDKVQTKAVVKIDDQQVKTLNFSGNPYGVALYERSLERSLREGEVVTIYYQKDKPYRVSSSSRSYGNGKEDIWKPAVGGAVLLLYSVANIVWMFREKRKSAEFLGHKVITETK